jgi:peptidoglycan hydrolase CwlO-like protein
VLNAALVAGAVRLHLEVRHATVPIAAISVDVKELKADQAGVHAKLEESRAQLDDARYRLDEQRIRIDEQATALAATAQQQKDAEHEAREHEAREARDLAALTARMNRSDRRAYKLDEAIQLIDLVQGRSATAPPGGSEEHVVPIINP